ncbi:hypothetical protein [Segnochrobactrum spirostomi]|uniref:Uncharacterized protein n=1 Tax=Segnochrobactrum spirostomi TaxID=2608987 RepID=A0A6A7XZJ3_9HYPH|nr:hypothetical protein [Segnochrobactrum spirostomi]MQT12114.1 hypothetical protein [Segnochrobactrum spirostomi]
MEPNEIAQTLWTLIDTALSAPVPFITAIIFFGWLVWLAVRREYSTRLNNTESKLELSNARIADYERKLSGASPDEASARIENLEAQLEKLMPRRVTAEQREKIRIALNGTSGNISIGSDMACADAPAFSAGLTSAFRNAGWHVENPSFMGLSNPPTSGVGVRCADPGNPSDLEAATIKALHAGGVHFDVQPGRDISRHTAIPATDAQIVITPRVLD